MLCCEFNWDCWGPIFFFLVSTYQDLCNIQYCTIFLNTCLIMCGLGSVVGIATGYGLDGPGIETGGGGRDFPHLSRPAWDPSSLLYKGYRVFPGGKEWPGCAADHLPCTPF